MNSVDSLVSRFLSRLWLLYSLKQIVIFLAIWGFAYGVLVLYFRGTMKLSTESLLWGLCSALIILPPAIWLASRQLPARRAVRALIDREGECGGLVMASEEKDLRRWERNIQDTPLPSVRWRGQKPVVACLVSAAFLLLAFLLPQEYVKIQAGEQLNIGPEVERLNKQIEVLKDEKVLQPERAEALQKKLEQLKDQSLSRDPSKTLEALDHVKEVTRSAAKNAAEAARRENEQLNRAEAVNNALQKANAELNEKVKSDAMAQMAKAIEKAKTENQRGTNKIDEQTLKDLKDGKISPEKMKELAEALKDMKSELGTMLKKLQQEGLIDAETCEKCKNGEPCDGEALAKFLKENPNKSVQEGLDAMQKADKGGKGGINEGPGPAPLVIGDPTSDEGAKFKQVILPPSKLQQLKDAKIIGIGDGGPPKDVKHSRTTFGALEGVEGTGSANTQIILPQHRGTVERYFERPPQK